KQANINAVPLIQGNFLSGYVGIATTTPAYTLDVVGNGRFSNPVIVGTPTADDHAVTKAYLDSAVSPITGGDLWAIGGNTLTAKGSMGSISNHDIGFITNNTERMTILANGNVGIGTSSPESLIHVYSNTVVDTTLTFESILQNSAINLKVDTTDKVNSIQFYDQDTRFFVFGSERANNPVASGNEKDIAFRLEQPGGKFIFRTTNLSSSIDTRMVIDGDGNVGIGTNSPDSYAKLHVEGNTAPAQLKAIFKNTNSSGDFRISAMNNNGAEMILSMRGTTYAGGAENSGSLLGRNTTYTEVATNNTAPIYFSPNFNKTLSITSSQYVGIATTTPAYTLDVAGTARFTQPVIVATPTADDHAVTKAYVDSGFISGDNDWAGAGGDPTLTGEIYHTGNVGIGTNDPSYLVHLSKSTSSGTATDIPTVFVENTHDGGASGGGDYSFAGFVAKGVSSVNGNAQIEMYADADGTIVSGGGGFLGTTSDHDIAFGTNSAVRMTLDDSGNLGIGTTEPTEKLEVNGKLKIGNNAVSGENVTFDGSTSPGMRVANSSGYVSITPLNASWAHFYTDRSKFIFDKPVYSYGGSFSAYATYNLQLQTNGTTRMFIRQTDGKVGIGTTSPSAKLHIAGVNEYVYVDELTPISDHHLTSKFYVDNIIESITGASSTGFTGDLNMGGFDILNVDKLTVNTIDPLYTIGGINFSTYAPTVAGGVKEEYIGKFNIKRYNDSVKAYEYVIDFSKVDYASDLWLWRKVVDFSKDNVSVFITPYGSFANVYYVVEDNKVFLRSNVATKVDIRLIGNRFDWRQWKTISEDQTSKGMLIN
ncbi:MAG: hypothetical protein K9M44_04520, partial [Candidatus Pacebacteria bacterium]|nr:hypothetical protein [Candidatus Paceibacterota bacterium]